MIYYNYRDKRSNIRRQTLVALFIIEMFFVLFFFNTGRRLLFLKGLSIFEIGRYLGYGAYLVNIINSNNQPQIKGPFFSNTLIVILKGPIYFLNFLNFFLLYVATMIF